MIVKFKCGDSITIPKGCKAIVRGRSVVFEKAEEEVKEFKDGDVLCSIYDNTVLIFKDVSKCAMGYFNSHYNNKGSGNKHWNSESFHHATEEEKQLLFDKMEEQGLRWNAEKKKVENIRWRAKKGGDYYFIDVDLIVKSLDDTYSTFDNKLWDALNYFRTQEQATEAARRVRETLRKYHEEIGE